MTPRDVYQCQTDCPVITTSANIRNMTHNRIRQKSEPGHRILKVSGLQPVVRFLFSKSGPPPTSNLSARSATGCVVHVNVSLPYPPLENIRVMVIVWKLRGNIIRTAQCSVLDCVTQCSQHSYEQFLQVQQIGFVTLGPLRHA